MPDDQPTPEQHRAAQRDLRRRAQAAWNAAKRNQRAGRKPAPTRAGMHRKRSDG